MANVVIPYDDFLKLSKDSADKENIMAIMNTTFPDATCQVIAIKAILDKDDTSSSSSSGSSSSNSAP